MRFGYKASAEQFAPNTLVKFAIQAQEAGFESVFISDHFQPWRHTGGHAPFSLSWLGALGARTDRIVMGTSVLTPTRFNDPISPISAIPITSAENKSGITSMNSSRRKICPIGWVT